MIDARICHDPTLAPGLIRAIEMIGSQREVAERLGVTPRYLRMVVRRERSADYGLQVMLEQLIDEAAGQKNPRELSSTAGEGCLCGPPARRRCRLRHLAP